MPKYLIDMPEGRKSGGDYCPMPCENCAITKCPLANAKKAVEINAKTDMLIKGRLTLLDDECSVSMDGKPVTLYAVEDGK